MTDPFEPIEAEIRRHSPWIGLLGLAMICATLIACAIIVAGAL